MFYYRRLILPLVILFFNKLLIVQFIAMLILGLISILLIALQKPFKGSNLVEMGHEIVIILIMYHMFCFTEFVPDPEVRHIIGYSVVFITFLHLMVFYTMAIYQAIKAA